MLWPHPFLMAPPPLTSPSSPKAVGIASYPVAMEYSIVMSQPPPNPMLWPVDSTRTTMDMGSRLVHSKAMVPHPPQVMYKLHLKVT